MPGSPESSVTDPATIPPPSTRSSSPTPVTYRWLSSDEISESFFTALSRAAGALPPDERDFAAETCWRISSVIEFHSPQSGQRPYHLADS